MGIDIKIKKYEVIKDGWVASNWRKKGQIIDVAISRHIELENVREIRDVSRETLENKEKIDNQEIVDKVIKKAQNSNKPIKKETK